jgi:hypothetical protein
MISHKGMSMLLKHHALNAETSTDDDVKNCVNAAIGNSENMTPEEESVGNSEGGDDDEEEEEIENRDDTARKPDPTVVALTKQVAELTKKLDAQGEKVHNRNKSGVPDIDVEEALASEDEGNALVNRANEIHKANPNISMASAFIKAGREADINKAKK